MQYNKSFQMPFTLLLENSAPQQHLSQKSQNRRSNCLSPANFGQDS